MATIIFRSADGTEHIVTASEGLTVMEAAVQQSVPGIDADCGGACSCATCWVNIDDAWTDRVGPPDAFEADLLDGVKGVIPATRLSCQIKITRNLDGLTVRVPQPNR